jgi:hypothetical protein
MLTISNVYGHGYDEVQVNRLRSLGFEFREPISRFAGSQLLRFVDFAEGPALEFIEVQDEIEYVDFLPTGMTPYCPGISLLLAPDSSTSMAELKDRHEGWGPNTRHVSYNESDDPHAPGWNYLNFDDPVVRDTFVYVSQPEDPRPISRRTTRHPNTATRVVGLIFDLERRELVRLAHLIGAEAVGGEIETGGVKILSVDAVAAQMISLPVKRFPLAAIVVQAESIGFFEGVGEVAASEFFAKPSVHIEAPDSSWDLIVTT